MPYRKTPCHGFSLIEVLVALVILSVGMMGLAKAYLTAVPAVGQDQEVTTAATAALAFWSLTQQQAQQPQAFTATTAAQAPAYLQSWMQQYSAALSGLRVQLTTGPDVLGNPCSSSTCALTLSMSWQDHGVNRRQTYVYQQGL